MPVAPPTFRPPGQQSRQERRRQYDRERGSSTQRGYGYKWQKASKAYLRKHPLCVKCRDEGKLVPATVVDHIKRHKGDPKLFWDPTNWQPLCKTHHDSKTAREDSTFVKGGGGC